MKKNIPKYEIIERIRKIDNPEKEYILNKKEIAITIFKEVNINGHNRPNI